MQKVRLLIQAISPKIYLPQLKIIRYCKIGFLAFFIPLELWSIYTQIALIFISNDNQSIRNQRIIHTFFYVPTILTIIIWFLVTLRFYVKQHQLNIDKYSFKKKLIIIMILILTFLEFTHLPNMIITRTISIYFSKPKVPDWYPIYRFIMAGIITTMAQFTESVMVCYMTLCFSKQ